jgi:hypothetical protein
VRPTSVHASFALDAFYTRRSIATGVRSSLLRRLLSAFAIPWRFLTTSYTRQLALHGYQQRIGEQHQFYARYVINDNESDEIRASRSTGTFSKRRIAYEVSYVQRLNTVSPIAAVTTGTGFYRVLGELDEYRDLERYAARALRRITIAVSIEGQRHDASGDDELQSRLLALRRLPQRRKALERKP